MVLATRPRALSIELRRDPFIYLVPDADRGEIPTTSQLRVHLGASDVPDVLGGVAMEGPW